MNFYKQLKRSLALLVCLGSLWNSQAFAQSSQFELLKIEPPSGDQLSLLPKNLTRWHLGVRLILPNDEGAFDVFDYEQQRAVPKGAFLSDDETEGVQLETGQHDVIVDLGDFLAISRFYCLSFGAEGILELRVAETLQSLDSPEWFQLGRTVPFQQDSTIDLRFPLADVRYIWVRLNIESPGEMGSFGAMGLLTANEIEFIGNPIAEAGEEGSVAMESDDEEPGENFEIIRSTGQNELISDGLPFDYGKVYSGTSVAYLNSGDPRLANFLIDDDVLTYYEVPPSETQPVFIMRLPEENNVEYVSVLMESGPGHMEVYFIDDLPFDDEEDSEVQGESARFWTLPGTNEILLLASNDPVLTAAIQFAQTSDFRTIQVDENFFENVGIATRRRVPESETRVRIPVLSNSSEYMMLRWVPDDGVIAGLRIFEVTVLGFVEPVERIVNYQFAPAASTAEFAALELGEVDEFEEELGQEEEGGEEDGSVEEGESVIPEENPVSQ